MDVDDKATELEERFRAEAIAAATQPIPAQCAVSESHCQNKTCGEEIPQARRDAVPGCRFCIECQEQLEKRLKGMGYAIHA
ncbi:TraR/DksA C4-type zinc finger protein [Paraburkholderia humisilvae]|uniref:TraR/DksA C4-type zinc finger protein n=1 Tax=Paraburkholderia humisilvae TaxID=627669 RepID=UPI001581567F|nr:TraR/DksA C4-type zinc finger protein [Paraburkholderia humisilvae]